MGISLQLQHAASGKTRKLFQNAGFTVIVYPVMIKNCHNSVAFSIS